MPHPNFSEHIERRRNTHSIQTHPLHHTSTKDSDKIVLEREAPQRNRLIKEKEEENLNEISFGTRRDEETENDNIFADSDTTSQSMKFNIIFSVL